MNSPFQSNTFQLELIWVELHQNLTTGIRHIEKGIVPKYADKISVRTYASGERRIAKSPAKEILQKAFEELGTESAVAAAFGVARQTVKHWAQVYGVKFESHPEAGLAALMGSQLENNIDKCRVSQWLMDEGCVSVAYFANGDYTVLLVCGSMNDFAVLSTISIILNAPITSSGVPRSTTLPASAVRVQSARAYALLQEILPYLVGLKAKETEAALKFFPPSGLIRGRHTTDEFLLPVWKDFSLRALHEWNKRRRIKMGEQEILERARTWLEARIKRARRFVEANKVSEGSELNSRSSSSKAAARAPDPA